MSQAFTWYNGLTTQEMIQLMQQTLFPIYGQPPTLNAGLDPKITQVPSQQFLTAIANIQNWWNLDRSEASRRTYVDAFIYEAMSLSKSTVLIVTPEEYIGPNNQRLGYGAIDDLVSQINKETTNPIYNPSVVIESKKSITTSPPVGQNQLWAQLVTLWQLQPTSQSISRGVLTDGRYWLFYEIQYLSNQFWLNSTIAYDVTNASALTSALGLLTAFFYNFGSANSVLLSIQ